ncbi:hypothetical protein [Persicobacter diffluens]|uniref:5'-methylthioadenosine/S-adenosylhomocysteine nucleosidase n=1 Tax=Persicobacter diffluens TaxID=981 RepID=A0AAN4VZK3_9BACT|nr:5'-methylthioadenosine/S-adenosylhomocysteine nucleosidase [Persicobacter diffluens]
MTFKKIVLIMAMHSEADPIRDALELEEMDKLHPSLPMDSYKGKIGQTELLLLVNGVDPRFQVDSIGTQPATLATFAAIQAWQPDLILNAGTCGAFKSKGAEIAKVYWGNKVIHHDRRISIPGFKEYGVGDYPVFTDQALAQKLEMEFTTISSGNSLDMCDTDYQILDQEERVVKEMEAAGIAYVAELMQVPYLGIKSVTDLVDGGMLAQDEFLLHLKNSSLALQQKVLALLQEISIK